MPHLSAPGNLLLAGEYAVLEEGGLGLCLAPNVRASLWIESAKSWEAEFRYEAQRVVYRGQGTLPPLLQAVQAVLGPLPMAQLVLDTTAFSPGGRKTGLGSSAAAALLLTAGFYYLLHHYQPSLEDVSLLAVDAHRRFQGGRGSGYDVLCSAWGGVTLFRGGLRPMSRPLEMGWLNGVALFYGAATVSTRAAVGSYQDLRQNHPDRIREYLKRNNELITQAIEAEGSEAALAQLRQLAELARELGRELGRSAELPDELKGVSFAKALGAGDELFWAFDRPERLRSDSFVVFDIAPEGLVWG